MERPGETVSSIAPALGYKSESAFSTAFKRHWGASPREHIRVRRRSSGAREMGELRITFSKD